MKFQEPGAAKAAGKRVIKAVRTNSFGRNAHSVNVGREIQAGKERTESLEEDEGGMGVVVDGRFLIPWTNILWVEYAT